MTGVGARALGDPGQGDPGPGAGAGAGGTWREIPWSTRVPVDMGSLIKKRRKRMRKKKHKKMLKATRWQRRAAGK
jgi:hypothetical protein